jgi:hypothetical protein
MWGIWNNKHGWWASGMNFPTKEEAWNNWVTFYNSRDYMKINNDLSNYESKKRGAGHVEK